MYMQLLDVLCFSRRAVRSLSPEENPGVGGVAEGRRGIFPPNFNKLKERVENWYFMQNLVRDKPLPDAVSESFAPT